MTMRRYLASWLRNAADRMDPPRRPTVHAIHVGMDLSNKRAVRDVVREIERVRSATYGARW
jgi:hypothetical protein